MLRLAEHPGWCAFLADGVLVVHFAFVVFVLVGLAIIWLGWWLRWGWVRNWWFRFTHLAAMGFVAWEAITGRDCPLTLWENQLRWWAGAGQRYHGSFIQHWIHRWLFYDASPQLFTGLYLGVFGLIVLSLWLVPPRWAGGTHRPQR